MEHNPNFNVALRYLDEYRTAREYNATLWCKYDNALKTGNVNELREIGDKIAESERTQTEIAESFAYHYDEATKRINK
jgi:hypothetical protein